MKAKLQSIKAAGNTAIGGIHCRSENVNCDLQTIRKTTFLKKQDGLPSAYLHSIRQYLFY